MRSTVQLLLLSVGLGMTGSDCGNPAGPESLPARLTILYNGPAASNLIVPTPTVSVSAGVLTVKAATGFGSGGYELSANASMRASGTTPAPLRIAVNAKSPQNALQILWLVVYEVEITRIPAGSYDLTLVRVDDDRPQPRVELRQTVSIP